MSFEGDADTVSVVYGCIGKRCHKSEGGVDYIYDNRNRALIPDSVRARVEELKQEIIAGRIKVPSTR